MKHLVLVSLFCIGLLACGAVFLLIGKLRKEGIQPPDSKVHSNQEILHTVYQQHNITPREQDVIGLIVQGYRNKQIGEELLVSVSTIKKYITRIYYKLNVTSRHELVALVKDLSGASSQNLSNTGREKGYKMYFLSVCCRKFLDFFVV